MSATAKPVRFRRQRKIYRLVTRKKSRFIAVRLCNGKQRSSKETEPEMARSFAYRWLATSYPKLAKQVGIAITEELPALSETRQAA
ncbi:MAG: hypothetical protein V4662_25110 [Verrucomicrobiota bacterium]